MNHRFAFFFAATAAIASLGAACSASPAPEVPPAPEETGTSEAELSLCKKDLCGPALGMPALLCADGSLGGNTGRCIREKGACHWEIRECPKPPPPPPTDCSAPNACGPAPGIPDQICDDGSVAGAKCVASKSGACGWQITTCPAPAPDKCGKSTCSKGQTCCSGMPFPEPTCVNGTMCPISQRKHKKDVSYLSESDKQRLSDELLGIPLATYRYKSEGEAERTHLGFIIDDIAPSPAVTSTGERVDMYGYATMSVAALQVQAKEIADLRRQIDDLKTELAKSRAPAKR